MKPKIKFGHLLGADLTIKTRPFLITSPILWAAYTALLIFVFRAELDEAVIAGLIGTITHWLFELGHQLGHAYMAKRVGYPMSEIQARWFLWASFYPRNEPELPASTHIRRALGGIPVSLTLSILSFVFALLVRSFDGVVWWVAILAIIQNLLLYTLGSLLPLGFTDGSTLLKYARQRK